MDEKKCSKCERLLPATSDYFNRQGKGLKAQCRMCQAEYQKQWDERNAGRKHATYMTNKDVAREKARVYYQEHGDEIRAKRKKKRDEEAARSGRKRRTAKKVAVEKTEKRCPRCKQTLPANEEHFYRKANGKLFRYCIECQKETAREQYHRRRSEETLAAQRKYYQEHREQILERGRQRRAQKREYAAVHDRNKKAKRLNVDGEHTAEDIHHIYEKQKGLCYYCKKHVWLDYHVDHVIPLSRGGSNGPENLVIACPECNMSKHNKLPHEWHGTDKLL